MIPKYKKRNTDTIREFTSEIHKPGQHIIINRNKVTRVKDIPKPDKYIIL